MKLLPIVFYSAFCCCATPAVASSIITSALELASVQANDLKDARQFELTGVLLNDNTEFPILDDGSAVVLLHGKFDSRLRRGDVLHAKGVAQLFPRKSEVVFTVLEYHRTGTREPRTPIEVSPEELASGRYINQFIQVRGRIADAFTDEIDTHYICLILQSGKQIVYATCESANFPHERLQSLVGADVAMQGALIRNRTGHRRFRSPELRLLDIDEINVLTAPINTPYAYPEANTTIYVSPDEVSGQGFRRLRGRVLAIWNENQMLIQSADGQFHRILLRSGQPLPGCGCAVTVGGRVETDFYLLNLSQALCAVESTSSPPVDQGTCVTAAEIFNRDRNQQIDTEYYGKTITLRGTVTTPNAAMIDSRCLYLDCKTHIIPVNISAIENSVNRIERGSEISVSGICILDVDNWHPYAPTPKIRGAFIVARNESDLAVISPPPWWTPVRITIGCVILSVLLVAIAIWNLTLNRLVKKRSRELLHSRLHKERAEIKASERTRLAVELHDSLSQNLTGIACQLSATQQAIALGADAVTSNLSTALRMLTSSRTELKRCLFDLRGDALETPNFETAIRKTLKPLEGPAVFLIKFHIHRAKIDESTSHAALCIIRELVSNAIRHGKATEIRIAGSLENGKLLFSVSDNGSGFDPASRLGPAEGHFGLQGIRERAARHGGTLSINSKNGHGTLVRASIVLPRTRDPSNHD